MQGRGVDKDLSTIMRWVQRYAPELEKRVRWYQGYRSTFWRVDETYVKVGHKWKYLFRAVTAGWLIASMLSGRRDARAVYRFLAKILTTMRHCPPLSITTDQLGFYRKTVGRLHGKASCQDRRDIVLAVTSTTSLRRIMERFSESLDRLEVSRHEDGCRYDQELRGDAHD